MVAKRLGVIACVPLLGVAVAGAQEYPQKPITVVVPFAAGGPTDTVARLLGVAMGKSLKTQILVENVGGAGGAGCRPAPGVRPDAEGSLLATECRRRIPRGAQRSLGAAPPRRARGRRARAKASGARSVRTWHARA